MKPSNLSLNKLALLVTTMLFTPSFAHAQTAEPAPTPETAQEQEAPPADAPPADEGVSEEGEIVVLGRFIPEPMRETSEVATFLSAEDLSRQGDSNAASALTRLTGLSVVQGRFVYVRGLGDRYSSALLNGSPLPSPEPLRRQVPLNLFPSNILDGATVQKTFSPNYPGEFGGGIIDLRTLRMPSEPFFTLKLGTAYNDASTDEWGLTYFGSDNDWTGTDNGLRSLPGPLAAAINSGLRVNDSNFTPDELETIGESLTNSPLTVVQRQRLDPDFTGEGTAGATLDIGGDMTLGLVGVLGANSQWRTREAERVSVISGAVDSDTDSVVTAMDVVYNAFGGASLEWGANDHISLTGLLVRSTTKQAEISEGTDADLPAGVSNHTESTAWYERQLGSIQLAGEHTLGDLQVDWRGGYAESTRDAPYERSITYQVVNDVASYPGNADANSTRFSYLSDEVLSGGIDGTYTIALSDERDAIISAGWAYSKTEREYQLYSFAFRPTITQIPSDVLQARPDFLFSPDNIDPLRFELEEFTGPDDSYNAALELNAGYVQVDAEIIPLVRTAVGVRYEDATQDVITGNRFGETPFAAPVSIAQSYWLPAGTLTWNFAEDMQLRFGYSQTIARPQFRELAFTPYIDPETDRLYQGNPYLTDSEFKNYDARFEFYFGRNQFVTLGAFYKTIENPIEEVLVATGTGNTFTRFINAPEATLQGAEIEYRTNFEMPFAMPMVPEDATWLFAVNYTYTSSEVTSGDVLVVNPVVLPNLALVPASTLIEDGSQLQGTPEHIANMQFGFESEFDEMTLLVGYVSERISRRGLGGLPTVWEDPGTNLDLVYRHTWPVGEGSEITLGFSGRNLLDQDHEEYQLSPLGRTEFNTYPVGRTFSITLTGKY